MPVDGCSSGRFPFFPLISQLIRFLVPVLGFLRDLIGFCVLFCDVNPSIMLGVKIFVTVRTIRAFRFSHSFITVWLKCLLRRF